MDDLTQIAKNDLRSLRNALLVESDKYLLPDFPISDYKKEEWNTYNLHFSDDSNSKEWIEHYQDFDTIEDLLGFIKSNWEVK